MFEALKRLKEQQKIALFAPLGAISGLVKYACAHSLAVVDGRPALLPSGEHLE